MKAIVNDRYGSPDVMELRDVDLPEATGDQVLVRVRAASVNALDWHLLRGKPYMARIAEGLRRPKTTILGADVAGVVEAVGPDVIDLKVGDAVYGSQLGGFADYVAGRTFVPIPAGLTFEQAAAVPTAGLTALQGLRDKGGLQAGQRVLVNGAGGGVGTFAVQIARAFGAEVTATTSSASVELVASLGAHEVIDHTRDDFTRLGPRFDLVFDIGGQHSLAAMRRALVPTGKVVLVAPAPGQWLGPITRILAAAGTSIVSSRKVLPFLSTVSKDDLLAMTALIEAGKVRPVMDRAFALAETAEAVRYVEAGHARGKVVITG